MNIGNKRIGERTYVIAEFGVNHNGSLERALEGVRVAAKCGADAIKFQTYTADDLVVKGTPKFWDAAVDQDKEDQHAAYEALEGFKDEWYPIVIKECEKNNIEFLSTPFSFEAADFLNGLGMQAFKVASSDMSTLPFLKHIAKFQKPILLSTGASTLEEVREAVHTIESEGNHQIIILHCSLCYPTDETDSNLNVIKTLQYEFPEYHIGISDHTLGKFHPMVAVAMGACVVEKHFTLDKTLDKSADHWLSVDPSELTQIVEHIRRIELMRGGFEKKVYPQEQETRRLDKRSIVSKRDIKANEAITADMVTYKRPGTGIWPKELPNLIGKEAINDIPADSVLTWELFR